ncbi:iron-sulfur cluster assembly protein [Pseudarthrobacter sp. lyk4-40-TYG-27]|uniref:iron-sulfur cluster assembly protein n=1 Tax=Pseudarthrobacter sp. lyk4-40-TYG-27 TaxID=3040305 RepID=UPI00255360F1|nr:iron-sulfur cluster assembly protein [Pseudarthrobacter sp. lyk4-40-TYG-27]
MTAEVISLEAEVMTALDSVLDPELDQPITALGFVRSVAINAEGVEVHLRLPTSFCSPNFAYLMVSDAYDALSMVSGIGRVTVELDDHHDSEKINAGIAAGAGYRDTFGGEAEDSLEGLRSTFQRKAHLASTERVCMDMLRRGTWTVEELPMLELFDLPENSHKHALQRRREAIGLPNLPHSRVLVNERGESLSIEEVPMRLRFARTTRIAIEGNAHFCRGLLATRYADTGEAGPDGTFATVITNTRRAS